MVTVNTIPSEAIIIETLTALIISIVAVILYRRYRSRPRLSTLYLFITVLGFSLAVWVSNIGKILDFTSDVGRDVFSYSGFAINLAYCFVALANIFLYSLTENVFFSNNRPRKLIVSGVFGILIGIIINLNQFVEEAYSRLFPFIITFVLLSFVVYGILAVTSFKEVRKTDNRKVKIGFTFISLFGTFLIAMFVFFVIDLVKIQLTGDGYNLEYYLGWISGAIASIFAYLGFTMPDWVVSLFGVEEQ